MAKRVLILGGGVAGLSAAHELMERGFEVQVLERRDIPGGKARSVPVPKSGVGGRPPLPGEHGFRFFPGFYKHLPDTMKRIPFGSNRHGVFDNLVGTTRLEYPRIGQPPLIAPDKFPTSIADLELIFEDMHVDLGLQKGEASFFAKKMIQIATSCEDRRLDEYERLPWWDFVDAANKSEAYQKYLAIGLTRSLNACKATSASTKTIGDILLQLTLDMVTPGKTTDRLLNGPTNDAWINPWLEYLRKGGVKYDFNVSLRSFEMSNGSISGVHVHRGREKTQETVKADYYIAAVPLEIMAPRVSKEMLAADPTLSGIQRIQSNVQWMNGIQFYLKTDVPLTHGHLLFADSAWALTAISQQQFWKDYDLSKYGDGTIRGILSVDISEWEKPGSQAITGGQTAMECTREQIAAETWFQVVQSLNYGTTKAVPEELPDWFLDPDIVPRSPSAARPAQKEWDLEPLLVNYINSWDARPDSYCRIPNLFFASDYVRTFTDLATMEGANEAARRAVNGIIDRSGTHAKLCDLWKLHEPFVFAPWRTSDQRRYDRGQPWSGKLEPTGIIEWLRGLFQ